MLFWSAAGVAATDSARNADAFIVGEWVPPHVDARVLSFPLRVVDRVLADVDTALVGREALFKPLQLVGLD